MAKIVYEFVTLGGAFLPEVRTVADCLELCKKTIVGFPQQVYIYYNDKPITDFTQKIGENDTVHFMAVTGVKPQRLACAVPN